MPSLINEDLTRSGTHALVIGVSRYLHFADGSEPTANGSDFGMEQLSAAARSASEFAAWLLGPYRRSGSELKSLRVLLSPAVGEVIAPAVAALLKDDYSATLGNAKIAIWEFRAACASHQDNVAIVYVAGHGIQLTKTGAILLLSDFGSNAHLARLEGALDMAGIHAGFNHPAAPRTQFWFVDACRQRPAIARRFESLEGALKLDVPLGDTESSPMFLAATTGCPAYARPSGLTLFNEALMWALGGAAAAGPEEQTPRWHVPVTQLIRRLPERVKTLALAEGAEQSVDIAGKIHEAVFHELSKPPTVDLHIDVRPEPARPLSRGTLLQNGTTVVVNDYSAWPLSKPVDAGLYLLNIKSSPPYQDRSGIIDVKPPVATKEFEVSP